VIDFASQIVHLTQSHRPVTLLSLDPAPPPPTLAEGSTEADVATPSAITCVAWAPSCGRSYHLIATGGRDGHVRIWSVKPAEEDDQESDVEDGKWSASIVADFAHHE
jgi:nucleoporin SEH1